MFTDREFLKYQFDSSSLETIKDRFEKLVDKVEEAEQEENRLGKYYESAMEQSSFRAEVIESILEACKDKNFRYTETKELVKEIQAIVENSYVEL